MITAFLLCAAARVVDGDTIYCSAVGRVRMAAIDAPDKASSRVCRLHIGDHVCDDAKAQLATYLLTRWTYGHRITFRQVGYDFRNKRVVGQFRAAGIGDLQCFMLKLTAQPAIASPVHYPVVRYMASYDHRYGYPIAHHCPAIVRNAARAAE
jgi:endonuclease YncB( thermonuclease family)